MDVESASNREQMADLDLSAGLDPLDGVDGDTGQVAQPFLGHVLGHAPGVDAAADLGAGIEDPLGQRVGHSTHAATSKIIRPQQFCGINRS